MRRTTSILALTVLLAGCAAPGLEGDPCETDEDCDEGLSCHEHDEGDAVCEGEEAHDDHDEHEDDTGEHDE